MLQPQPQEQGQDRQGRTPTNMGMPESKQRWTRQHNRQAMAIHLVTDDGRNDDQGEGGTECNKIASPPRVVSVGGRYGDHSR
jgi:hypothetical protein